VIGQGQVVIQCPHRYHAGSNQPRARTLRPIYRQVQARRIGALQRAFRCGAFRIIGFLANPFGFKTKKVTPGARPCAVRHTETPAFSQNRYGLPTRSELSLLRSWRPIAPILNDTLKDNDHARLNTSLRHHVDPPPPYERCPLEKYRAQNASRERDARDP